jgi:hypothetical protein
MPADNTRRDCACPLAKHEHGTPPGYWADQCRCFPCRTAYDRHVYRQRHGQPTTSSATLVDATGTRRRLEALHCLGWSGSELGARLGIGYNAINQLRKQTVIFPRTADRVRELYDEVWAVRGSGRQATRITRWAVRSGFVPPLAWDDDTIDDPAACPHDVDTAVDAASCNPASTHRRGFFSITESLAQPGFVDEVAVERAMTGDPVNLTTGEVSEVIRRMTSMGHSAAEIGERLHISQRTVQRWRDEGHAA